ncbi:methyltransferase domain-containing protein [Daldinia bambusicola]|nr:methyltransferase domain-containing protein [Daldinia bambusicola]
MCRTIHFRSRCCRHHWLQIWQPCGYAGNGFSRCGSFGDGVAREPARVADAAGLCPACRFAGAYDKNQIRMVVDVRSRWRWGFGPSKCDPGCECAPSITMPFVKLAGKTNISGTWGMLPTPDTSHVAYERVYEPAEDSFLLLDTLSSASETAFLQARFGGGEGGYVPLVVEVGPGSGVVIAFVNAQAQALFGSRNVLTAAVDANAYACQATRETARKAALDNAATHGAFVGAFQGDLVAPVRDRSVDVLVFNPPYVPTPELPKQPPGLRADLPGLGLDATPSFDDDSYLLALSYAGGRDGMETTDRLIESLPRVLSSRGCAYVLLCAQNKPEEVKQRIQGFGEAWKVATVGSSGKQAGWEKLQIIRIWIE